MCFSTLKEPFFFKRAFTCGRVFLKQEKKETDITEERAQSLLYCLNSVKGRTAVPLKQFQRLLGHMAAAVTPLGLLHIRPLQHWLHGPRWAWQPGTGLSHRPVAKPLTCHQTLHFFGQECPWSRSKGMLWYTRMPPPLAGVPRTMAKQSLGVDNIHCLELLAVCLALNSLKGHI